MGRVGKAVVRQGREAHNSVNTCITTGIQEEDITSSSECQRKGQTVERIRALGRIQDCESFICNFKIPGHKCFFNSSS